MNVPFTFDHSAIDYEGDSLVYSVTAPFHGGSRFDPVPDPPAGPPYTRVVFRNPYSVTNVLGGVPMSVDNSTGLLKATPNSLGQFIYGITVKEYRNGILLGETTRDFQVNVVSCPEITVASIFSPTISCGTLSANFENTSYNAATYHWDFGELGILSDTSSLMNPTYAYADTGDYTATLIAYSGINPDCNDTAVGKVHIYPVFNSDFVFRNVHCSNRFEFLDRSYGIGGVANFWKWTFGDDSVSSDINPVHNYSQPGIYDVALITSTDSSCYDTLMQKVVVQQNPISAFQIELDTCSYTIKT
jgi:PKD repeat protein